MRHFSDKLKYPKLSEYVPAQKFSGILSGVPTFFIRLAFSALSVITEFLFGTFGHYRIPAEKANLIKKGRHSGLSADSEIFRYFIRSADLFYKIGLFGTFGHYIPVLETFQVIIFFEHLIFIDFLK